MGWFDGFRDHGHNTYYGDHRSPVFADVTQMLVILICIMITASLVIVIAGTRGRERWTTFLRVAFTLHTGIAILITIFGQEWQVAFVQSHCSYSTLFQDEIMAYINVRVGLKSVNITLEGDLATKHGKSHVDYNERFSFDNINDMHDNFQDAKIRGLPQPILYVAEYFGVDAGGLTWQRSVRLAGHFVFILEWTSFAAWLVSNIVVNFVVFHGAAIMALGGAMMAGSCIIYSTLQPATPFTIPFEDGYIHFHYGWCFWVCAVSGVITFLTGLIVLGLYKLFPLQVQLIFLLDTSHLVEDHEEGTNCPPLELEQISFKRGMANEKVAPPVYINPAFTDDSNVRIRQKLKAQSSPLSAASGSDGREGGGYEGERGTFGGPSDRQKPGKSGLSCRPVSTISITSLPGQDRGATVTINGVPVVSEQVIPIPEEVENQESATAL